MILNKKTEFEAWLAEHEEYSKLIYMHGQDLLMCEDQEYCILTVRLAYHAYLLQFSA